MSDKVSAKKENDNMMTFREAVKALDAEGVYAAKRPSMLGYVYKQMPQPDNSIEGLEISVEGVPATVNAVVVAKDGRSFAFAVMQDGSSFAGLAGEISMDAEKFNAFVFADDWEIAKREELEKARAGAGTM